MTSLRTRFAPSPTGFLHLGSARTALFNWAYARRFGGRFALRIEDTDRERSTPEAEQAILDGLSWLGLDWDEGPYRQSERRERHLEVIEDLLAHGRAYRCVCTREELEERQRGTPPGPGNLRVYDGRCLDLALCPDCGPHTVRLRMPVNQPLAWEDRVSRARGQNSSQIGDMIIRRSDGGPLYNLAVVVDDLDMGVTHVIRGADHLGNTSLQIAIYRALGAALPVFAHLPLIVGEGGKKLSKRRDPVSVQQFREAGYLPDALRNWLARLGWSHGDREIFSREDLARLFDLDAVGNSAAQADTAKLDWLNQHYLKALPMDELFPALASHLARVAGHPVERSPRLGALLDLLRERSTTLSEMAERAEWLLKEKIEYDQKAAGKHLQAASRPILESLRARLAALEGWEASGIEAAFEAVRAERGGIGMGRLAQPVRVAVTGSAASPGIYQTLEVLGRERALERIGKAIDFIDGRDESATGSG